MGRIKSLVLELTVEMREEQVRFASVITQTVLMPFKNRVHNHLEIGSLVLNFLLFDIALLATSGGEGSNADNVAAVSLVLDLVRVAAFLALGGYGVYENRASFSSLFYSSSGTDDHAVGRNVGSPRGSAYGSISSI